MLCSVGKRDNPVLECASEGFGLRCNPGPGTAAGGKGGREAPCPALIPACRGWGWVGRGVGGWVGFKWSGLCEAFEKLLDFDYAEGGEVVASPDSG